MKRGKILLAAGAVLALGCGAVVLLSHSADIRATSTLRAVTVETSRPPQAPSSIATPSHDQAVRRAATVAAADTVPAFASARLSIPRIGIRNAPVYDRGTTAKGVMLIAPGYAVTHYAGSAPFGAGNAVLYGHDDIEGNIFGRLYDLAPGDIVQLAVGSQTQVYRVTGHQIVAPTAMSVLAPTSDARLTIITCWPFNVDTKRWIVTAVRAS
ncbi:MAG: sortase [Candidatus Dormibacteraeota bacterium]|nr:sortase [Candidatus Dormibacteraeota bacterium]